MKQLAKIALIGCLPEKSSPADFCQELVTNLRWSGVIVRHFDFTFSMRWALFAVAGALLLTPQLSHAQLKQRPLFGSFPRTASLPVNTAPKPDENAVPKDNIYRESEVVNVPANVTFDDLLDSAIKITSKRYLTAESADPHSPWQIFHCILAMRQETLLRTPSGKVNAIQWLSTTEPKFRGEPWMMLTEHGAKFHPYSKTFYFEGHPAQFLALLSHSNLPVEHQFRVQGRMVTLADVINNTMMEVCDNAEEKTWVLWALQHYLKPDAVWVNHKNETWSIERLVQIETAHPVVDAACGGNHRLFALTKARDKYLKAGGTLRGIWADADAKIRKHIDLARSLQNSDGSFSGESYKGPKFETDVNKRFNTTGHTMEFLSVALPQERLQEPWVRNAVWMLSRELVIYQRKEIDCGPLFHTLNALIQYRDRTRSLSLATKSAPAPKPAVVQPVPVETVKPTTPTTTPTPTDAAAPSSTLDAKPVEKPETEGPVPVPADSPSLELRTEKSTAKPAPITIDSTLTKSSTAPVKTVTPKVNPDALSNIGKPAPAPQALAKKSASPKWAKREPPPGSAPALLPDVTATPLNELDALAEKLSDVPMPIIMHAEEPVSALTPTNE